MTAADAPPPDAAGKLTDVLALADDALIAAQRLSEWTANAPELEEDVALTNIALDLLGQARALFGYASELDGAGRGEDDYAFLRDEREFHNCHLVELPRGHFGTTVARMLFFAAYQRLLYQALSDDDDVTLAAIAAKSATEVAYHLDHATQWTLRLGDGTPESHRRIQSSVDELWPYTFELFETRPALREPWLSIVDGVLAEATLSRPAEVSYRPTGGRSGIHTEHMGYLLAELQYLHRSHPGATW